MILRSSKQKTYLTLPLPPKTLNTQKTAVIPQQCVHQPARIIHVARTRTGPMIALMLTAHDEGYSQQLRDRLPGPIC